MKFNEDLFWQANFDDLKRGYLFDVATENYTCFICGHMTSKGHIYVIEDLLLEGEKAMQQHILQEHKSMFDFLLNLDKKFTGLTEHQKIILKYFYEGYSDNDILGSTGANSASTIRNHRFNFREKHKQSRIFLALMELLEDKSRKNLRSNHKKLDNQLNNNDPNRKVLTTYFKQGENGPLSTWPAKEKNKLVIFKHIMQRLEPQKEYTEKEINTILKNIFSDYVTLRRELIDYDFLDRTDNGSSYWVKSEKENVHMDRRAELKLQYKDSDKTPGVLKITNKVNGHIFIGSSMNVNAKINRYKFELKFSSDYTYNLLEESKQYGADNYSLEVLEYLEPEDIPNYNIYEELEVLKANWKKKLELQGHVVDLLPQKT